MDFMLLDSYADANIDKHPEAWRKHGLHLFSPTDTALTLGVSMSTLRRWRQKGRGPKPSKRQGKIMYRFGEIYSFLAEEAAKVGYVPTPFSLKPDNDDKKSPGGPGPDGVPKLR